MKKNNTCIKQIVFDCDGILLESTEIKTLAFAKTTVCFGDEAQKVFLDYHKTYFGRSRMEKFQWFCDEVLKSSDSSLAKNLCLEFAATVEREILSCPLVEGVLDALESLHKIMPLYVCSGTPEFELKKILKMRDLAHYFKEIYGTPPEKQYLLKEIVEKSAVSPENTLMVGDAQCDLDAANSVGTQFYGRGSYFKLKNVAYADDMTKLVSYVENFHYKKG